MFHLFADAFLDRRDELIRDRSARHAIEKREVQLLVVMGRTQTSEPIPREVRIGIDFRRKRVNPQVNFGELTGTARLLLVAIARF